MYKCKLCPSVFTMKNSLVKHVKAHSGVRFLCTACPSSFSYKNNLTKHTNKFHPVVNVPAHRQPTEPASWYPYCPVAGQSVENFTPSIVQSNTQEFIQTATQIFVSDAPARDLNIISNDDLCMAKMDELEDKDMADAANNCKERWRNIKDTYMNNKKKLRKGPEIVINKVWSLALLDKVKIERSTITNVSEFSPSVNEMLAEDDDVDENKDIKPNSETNVPSTKEMMWYLFFRRYFHQVYVDEYISPKKDLKLVFCNLCSGMLEEIIAEQSSWKNTD
eukprot:XP_016665040.1 PREDICTED: uncharacterized protein LOC107885862 [Acyrthosiphon pisum]